MSRQMFQSAGLVALITLGLLQSLHAADQPVSRTFTAKGVKLHYWMAGKGEPVILLHGLASSADLNWKLPGVIDELAKTHQVIALDLPGHGRSDKPTDEAAYGQQVVEDVVLLMDHLKLRKAHLVGYSIGGMVTLRFIADHPDRVITGTLGGMGWLKTGSGLQKFWDHVGGRNGKETPKGFLSGISAFALTEQEVKKIKVPVSIIIGDQDPCQAMYVVPLQKIRPDWAVTEIKDAGHFNCLIKPEFKAAISHAVKSQRK